MHILEYPLIWRTGDKIATTNYQQKHHISTSVDDSRNALLLKRVVIVFGFCGYFVE